MPEVHTLRLIEMIRRQKGGLARRSVHAIISIALRLFFRRIQASDVDRVPVNEPLIFVLNHPNGLIDPGLVYCALPRRVSFLAKSTLFRMPVVRRLMRVVEALPLYRRLDPGEDPARNRLTFEACHDLLRQGRCIALFPEGISHGQPYLMPLKTGAARIALGALSLADEDGRTSLARLKIVPVGLYYASHTLLRSEALIQFGEYLEVRPVKLDQDGEPPREAVRELTQSIEAALRGVTLSFADAAEQDSARKAGQLLASAYQTLQLPRSLLDEFRSQKLLIAGRRAAAIEAAWQRFEARLQGFLADLNRLGLGPAQLALAPGEWRRVWWQLLLKNLLLVWLFPVALAGAVLHLPAYLVCELLAHFFKRHGPDESGATAKVLAGITLMPLVWLLAAVLAWRWGGWRAALMSLPANVISGYVCLRWVEEVYDLRSWLRALLILWRRRTLFLRLLRRRFVLNDEARELSRTLTHKP